MTAPRCGLSPYRVILDREGRVFLDGGRRVPCGPRAGGIRRGLPGRRPSRVARSSGRALARRPQQWGGVVEGRDIGTVVFPEAPVKVFLDASPAVRARRRSSDEGDRDVGAVQSELHRRDDKDAGRAVAPLRRARDAHLLDTSDLTLEETVGRVAALVRSSPVRQRTPRRWLIRRPGGDDGRHWPLFGGTVPH